MRIESIRKTIFITPIVLLFFLGHLFSRLPFNIFIPFLTLRLLQSRGKSPMMLSCVFGLWHDILLPSPRIGAYSLSYVLMTTLLTRFLKRISSTENTAITCCLLSFVYALGIEVIAHGIISLLGIPSRDHILWLTSYVVLPSGTLILTLALYAAAWIFGRTFDRKRSSRYE